MIHKKLNKIYALTSTIYICIFGVKTITSVMRKSISFFTIVMTILIVTNSCSKKEDKNPPVVKKKYAWVAGMEDSTGYGLILYSADAGETWVRQGEGLAPLQGINVGDIWAVDEDVVWAIGSNNAILRSQNGGAGWIQIQAPPHDGNPNLMAISIVNNTNIWISGSGGTVYNSSDGGNTWTLFDTTFFHNGGMQGIWAITPEKVYVVGGIGGMSRSERGFIGYTLNGGATWDSVFPADDYNRNEWIGVTSAGNTIVVYGGKSHYMVSTNGGTIWKNDSIHVSGGGGGADINHLIMLNQQTWWGALDEGHICLTMDGGSTWTSQHTGQGGYYLVGIDAWDSQLALVVGTSEQVPKNVPIIKTSNGGTQWEVKYTCNTDLNKVSFIKQ